MWEVNLGVADKQSLIEMFLSMAKDQLAEASYEAGNLAQLIDKLEEEAAQLEGQCDDLRIDYERANMVLQQAGDRLRILQSKCQQKALSFQNASDKTAANGRDRRRARFDLEKARTREGAAISWLEDTSWASQSANMLLLLQEHIDPDHPIRIDPQVPCVSWKTQDIYINDGFGGKIPVSFGSYWIRVESPTSSGGVSSVHVTCKLDPDRPSSSGMPQYPHPHISNESPCLGNAHAILGQMMATKDFAGVVVVMTEFLISYNYENPYFKLRHMGIPNRWESPVCETGLHLATSCDCLRCPSCGEIKQPHQMSDCGVCTSCCIKHHFYHKDAHRTRSGINGTGCAHRAAPRIQYRVEETKHEGDRQEDAQVLENSVGQDVGHDAEVQG